MYAECVWNTNKIILVWVPTCLQKPAWSRQCCLLSALWWFFAWHSFQPWRWRWDVPLKSQLTFFELHSIIAQKIELCIYFIKINWSTWVLRHHMQRGGICVNPCAVTHCLFSAWALTKLVTFFLCFWHNVKQ